VFALGTTGESLSLSTTERMAIAEEWAKQVARFGFNFIVHVGHDSVPEAIRLARHAATLGAHAIAAHPPTYFRPQSLSALVTTMAAIAAGAPNLPYYYYHFPDMTKVLVGSGIEEFVALASANIPTFNGLKFTDVNLWQVANLVRFRDDSGRAMQVLLGKDELFSGGLIMGVDAFVGSTYNYAAPLYNRMMANWPSNVTAVQTDMARAQQFIGIFASMSGGDNISGNKVIMTLKTKIDMGPPRLPQIGLTPAQVKDMDEQLQSIGFYEWTS